MEETTLTRSWIKAMWRGAQAACPSCGQSKLFRSYLKVEPHCANCGAELYHQRADDAPPYFTMMIVAHTIIPGLLLMERLQHPPLWLHAVVWFPATIILSWWLMPRVKGAIIGLQWANRMHGFGSPSKVDFESLT